MWSILSRLWSVGWKEQGRARKWLGLAVSALPWLGTSPPVQWVQQRIPFEIPDGIPWWQSAFLTALILLSLMAWQLAKQIVALEGEVAGLQQDLLDAETVELGVQLRPRGKVVELVLINTSLKTVEDVRVFVPNILSADGTKRMEIQKDLVSVDGRRAPFTLNPTEQPAFQFAYAKGRPYAGWEIWLKLGDGAEEVNTQAQQVGVKFRITGRDVHLPRIDVLVTCDKETGAIKADLWNPKHRFTGIKPAEWVLG